MKSFIITLFILFYSVANSNINAENHYLHETGWVNVEIALLDEQNLKNWYLKQKI